METITLEQVRQFFAELRSDTQWNLDEALLWGYFFLSPDPDRLMAAGGALADLGYTIVGVFDDSERPELHILQIERAEAHTPETLHARCAEFDAFAADYGLDSFDGIDAAPVAEEPEPAGEEEEEEEGDLENPKLIAAIEAALSDDSEAAQEALTARLQEALYLLPVDGEMLDEEQEVFEAILCTDEQGNDYMPLFTSVAALRRWTKTPISAVGIDAAEAWRQVLEVPGSKGAIIDPEGHALRIPRERVEALLAALEEGEH